MTSIKRFTSILALAAIAFHLCGTMVVFAADTDTDGDGLPDLVEDANGNKVVDTNETDPLKADTDGGGESDGSEVKANRNPLQKADDLSFDADGDGWVNGTELLRGTDPKKADTDGDGVNDSLDPFPLNPAYSKDANANGLPDEWEAKTGLDKAKNADTSAKGDPDNDGLTNQEEFELGLNPLDNDTDRDGLDDEEELRQKADPKENACLEYGGFAESFADMKGHWGEEYVFRLQQTSILPDKMPVVRGYANAEGRLTSFAPDKPVTRFEFLKMILLSTCTKLNDNSLDVDMRFSDVLSIPQENETADQGLRRRVVYTGVQFKIVQGYTDGTFRPDAPITRAEALKMLALAAQLEATTDMRTTIFFPDVKITDWFAPYLLLALHYDIVSGYADGRFRPGQSITRAEAAKIVYVTMLVNPFVNGYVLPSLDNGSSPKPAASSSSSAPASLSSSSSSSSSSKPAAVRTDVI